MKKLILLFGLLGISSGVLAAGGGGCGPYMPECDKANIDMENKASLQRGAKLFVNYCMGCHSAKYMSYQRLANDLGLTEDQVVENLMFTGEKVGEYMNIAMPGAKSKVWFGTPPPDLSLVVRSRGAGDKGADWLYTYMRTFYLDPSRPFGVNNLVFPNVGMPHVLWQLQGHKEAIFEEVTEGDKTVTKFMGFKTVSEGEMTDQEYNHAVRDLVNFLAYVSEPYQLDRKRIGVYVLLFLAVLFVVSYLLKKEYWKDVH